MKKLLTTAIAIVALSGCQLESAPQQTKQTQTHKAAQAAQQISFTENAEIENIKRRLELTSSPSLIGYILLLNQAGQPVMYTTVKGKVTSGSKRLTPPVQQWNVDKGQYAGTTINVAPSDEGTWGSSGEYIYFWDTNGAYHQWLSLIHI